jgi:hypothetical protein
VDVFESEGIKANLISTLNQHFNGRFVVQDQRYFRPEYRATGGTCLPKPVAKVKLVNAALVACQSNPVTYKDFYVLKSRFADHGITF